ncbi:unnamed protein product, partial [Effrenium voratum]
MAEWLDVCNPRAQVIGAQKDETGAPWFREGAFVRSYFVDERCQWSQEPCGPHPPSFCRRLTINTWKCTLAGAMLEAGLRFSALLAHLKFGVEIFVNRRYAKVQMSVKLLFAGFALLGSSWWLVLAARNTWRYRSFAHPDSWLNELIAFCSSTLLSMFAMPNDVTLATIHLLPKEQGGLLRESGCIQGNKRWPAHSIEHHCRDDHDYTNWSGSKVQLPLLVFIDVGCSLIVIYLAITESILSSSIVLLLLTSIPPAAYRALLWLQRWRLRQRLFEIWLNFCADPLMPEA